MKSLAAKVGERFGISGAEVRSAVAAAAQAMDSRVLRDLFALASRKRLNVA